MQQEHTFINHWKRKHTNYNTLQTGGYLKLGEFERNKGIFGEEKNYSPISEKGQNSLIIY